MTPIRIVLGVMPLPGHDPSAYGAGVADDYDAIYGDLPETTESIERLAELAEHGPLLELGIGTGRIALPLAQKGLDVHGIEASEAMVAKLRGKPAGRDIPVALGDFAEVTAPGGPYTLACLNFNTIFALPGPEEQIRCFRRVAEKLVPRGRFVIEAFVADPEDYRHGHAVEVRNVSAERVELQLARYDPVNQRIERVLINISEAGTHLHAANDAYASPRELDLMARIAGLELEQRWEDWRRSQFTAQSRQHVTVYRKGDR
jgi:SAM-dependent methyltransferase